MDPLLYSTRSMAAGDRYNVVLAAFRSLLFNSLTQPFSIRAMETLRNEATNITVTYAKTELQLVSDQLRDTAQNAVGAVLDEQVGVSGQDIPRALEPFLAQSVEHLSLEISAQLARDVETLVRRYREFALQAQLTAYTRGVSTPSVSAGRGDQDRIDFFFRDRAGRSSPSERFIRVAWRQSMVALGAEFFLLEAASLGALAAEVVYADTEHRNHGLIIDLDGDAEGQNFVEVRDEVFHPNSDATLKAIF